MVPKRYLTLFREFCRTLKSLILSHFSNKNESFRSLQGVLVTLSSLYRKSVGVILSRYDNYKLFKVKSQYNIFNFTLLKNYLFVTNQVFLISVLLLDGAGFGISILIKVGSLKAVPKAIQVPGCNILILFTTSSVILGTISLI